MVTLKSVSRIILGVAFNLFMLQAHAVSGIYLWGEGGWAEQTNLPSADSVMAQSFHHDLPVGLRASVGYNHDFNHYFGLGVEVGAAYYGHGVYEFTQQSDVGISTNTMEFLSALNFHFHQWDFYSKLGGIRITPHLTGQTSAEAHTIIDGEVIIGTAYNFSGPSYLSHFAVTLNYITILQNFNNDDNIHDSEDTAWKASTTANALLLGIRYNFGPNLPATYSPLPLWRGE